MEAYDEIASVEISPEEVKDFVNHNVGHEGSEHHDLEHLEHEKIEMVQTRLRSMIAHAHQALDAIEKGSVIEPWMEEMIAISESNLVKTTNALIYKPEIKA